MGIFNKIKQYLSGQNINKDFEQEKPENWIWGVTVSYTHLDVYKRQLYE